MQSGNTAQSDGTPVNARIAALRQVMAQHGIDACIVLSSDPHLSEYLPEHWQVRQWLSGFDGSAGTLVVTAGFAGLWTDSRYWEQAQAQLGGGPITVMPHGKPDVPAPHVWLHRHLQRSQTVWVDQRTVPVQAYDEWSALFDQAGIQLVGQPDLINLIWSGRPPLPQQPVYAHQPPFACRTRTDNLSGIRHAMHGHGAQWHALASLDDIAWAFNLRGSDIPFNPVFLAHALIGVDAAHLFVAPGKLSGELVSALHADGVQVHDYDGMHATLAALPGSDTILFDPARTTVFLRQQFSHMNQIRALNPSQELKARKNQDELANVRRTMEYDGAALCEFFAWLDAALTTQTVTELTIDEQITLSRSRQPNFICPSFSTIAGFNANGAMPHYQATAVNHAVIQGDGLLLIDSGGQYLGGTTDITRMVPIGQVSDAQRQDVTRVLQGMIALSMAQFPHGTTGHALDAIARMPLWQAGLDYGHGTGHGVGYFMNVHEGPQSISPRARTDAAAVLQPGMITSNEPGLYRPDQWGIRIENLVLATDAATTDFGRFLRFETLTLCPIDTRCIAPDMLSTPEKTWLNTYHDEVRTRLAPHVSGAARDWLFERTVHI